MNIYLPYIGTNQPPPRKRPRFGIGIRSQSRIPTRVTLDLLNPPCYHNWGPWAGPGWMDSENQTHIYNYPDFQPASWNPPEDLPNGAKPDFAMTWAQQHVTANPGAFWLIGNEPVMAEPPFQPWVPVWRMAEHCIQFTRFHGVPIAPFGGIARHECDYDYGDELRRQLNQAGIRPAAWHWHIYPPDATGFVPVLERILRWIGDSTPLVITETNTWHQTDQRPLMETILQALANYPQLEAVYWYVNWEPPNPTLPNTWQLLDRDGPDAQLTETGKLYVQLMQ